MEFAELMLERGGKTGGARAGGSCASPGPTTSTARRNSAVPIYPPICRKQPLPALVFLHGYNPPNPPYVRWWSIADRHNGVAERNGSSCSSRWGAATSTIAGWANAT